MKNGGLRRPVAALLLLLAVGWPPSCGEDHTVLVCLALNSTGIDDRSFNALAWKGIRNAEADIGVRGTYEVAATEAEQAGILEDFVARECNLIVTMGYVYADSTAAAAEAHPEQKFVIVDYSFDPPYDNALGLIFSADQPAFLAGYLSAALSATGAVGTFGGQDLPPVTASMDGFALGAALYDEAHQAETTVLGWNPVAQTGEFAGSFADAALGRAEAESLIERGADFVFPVAGQAGLGAAAAAADNPGTYLIGVDTDWTVYAPDYASIILTSVLKNIDLLVYDAIGRTAMGTFEGGDYRGTLANGGVGLAPFHELADLVPEGLQEELVQVEADIIDGKIPTLP